MEAVARCSLVLTVVRVADLYQPALPILLDSFRLTRPYVTLGAISVHACPLIGKSQLRAWCFPVSPMLSQITCLQKTEIRFTNSDAVATAINFFSSLESEQCRLHTLFGIAHDVLYQLCGLDACFFEVVDHIKLHFGGDLELAEDSL
jgi:hypothetical protein